jgi:hypothetical protein
VVFDTNNQAVRDWVYNELVIRLESSGYRRFSLCLEERDWIPGLSCIENLHYAVHSSEKTVFVLSNCTRNDAGEATVNGVIQQTFFMVQQRLLDEKVFNEINVYEMLKVICLHSLAFLSLLYCGKLLLISLMSSQQGGCSRSHTAGQDVSQAEVPPTKDEVMQEVSDVLA